MITGVPPGVRVGVFNESEPADSEDRVLLLEEARNPEMVVTGELDPSLAGTTVKIVVRRAGFLPYQTAARVTRAGLWHAPVLEVDRVYSGPRHVVPSGWEAVTEHRRAEETLQDLLTEHLVPTSGLVDGIRLGDSAQAVLNFETDSVSRAEFASTFISYGGPDEELARRIHTSLQDAGVETFFFPEHSVPGEMLHEVMWRVNDYDRVLVVLSEAAIARPGVRNELSEAFAREAREGGRRILIPITADGHVFGASGAEDPIVTRLRDRTISDFSTARTGDKDFDGAMARLLEALRSAT